MARVVFGERTERPISPGILVDQIPPGGRNGPNGEVLWPTPGGQTWIYEWTLGTPEESFQLAIPDVRMPANQYWPLHYHGCWIAVVVLDGSCLMGDWWMQPGDVLISRADLEYGPAMAGPSGVQLFEVFAQGHLRRGGYAPEYRDHPTLGGADLFNFEERSPLNKRNEGRQVLPVDGVDGLTKSHLTPGAVFDLGEADDPERGVMLYTQLKSGQELPAHSYSDARAIFVFDGEVTIGERLLSKHELILIERGAPVPAIKAGADGAMLFEVTRTAAGLERRPA